MSEGLHLVFVTQVVDAGDPVHGAAISLARALAVRSASLLVIANEVRDVPDDLAGSVRSLGKEWGRGRLAKGTRYQRLLADACRRHRPVTLLAHMCPPYLTQGAPIVRATGGGSVLWYTHPSRNPVLRRAERLADAILTALPGSYPGTSPKVRAIGHSVDTDRFPATPLPARSAPLRLVALGRTSPVKHYPVMIRAMVRAREAGAEVELRIVGPSTTDAERRHRAELGELVRTLSAGGSIEIVGDVSPAAVPDLLADAHALVNATASADKVVFEAMAAGRPAVVSSPFFASLVDLASPPDTAGLRLSFAPDDEGDLAERIVALAEQPVSALAAAGARLRERVASSHSLDHWADEVVRTATEVQARRSH